MKPKNWDFLFTIFNREELVLQLMEYKKYHAAANVLAKFSENRGRYFTRPFPIDEDINQIEPSHLLVSEISLN